MSDGLELSLEILEEYPDREVIIPVLASAFEEHYQQTLSPDSDFPISASQAKEIMRRGVRYLLNAPEKRAPRELLRSYHMFPADVRWHVLSEACPRLIVAAKQLLNSDHTQTRKNVGYLASDILYQDSNQFSEIFSLLLVLIDDPQMEVRDAARKAFLDALDPRQQVNETAISHQVSSGLEILLTRYEQHHDQQVLRCLLSQGSQASVALARSLVEGKACSKAIREVLTEAQPCENCFNPMGWIECLFSWLHSQQSIVRDCAKDILKSRLDSFFLEACLQRLLQLPLSEAAEKAGFRYVRWDQLGQHRLSQLTPDQFMLIAELINVGTTQLEERSIRLGQLLTAAPRSVLRKFLPMLRDLPTEVILDKVENLLQDPNKEVQLMATELISLRGGRKAFALLVKQLSTDHEDVREAAQRRLSGHSLSFFFDSYSNMSEEERISTFSLLQRVDLHFYGQLKRSLKSQDEEEILKALQSALLLEDLSQIEDYLYDLTVSPSPKIRATLAHLMGKTRNQAGFQYLRSFLEDSDKRVVANAVEALSNSQDPQAQQLLSQFTEHPSPRVRSNALLGLASRGDKRAHDSLQRLVSASSTQKSLRDSCDWALKKLKAMIAQEKEDLDQPKDSPPDYQWPSWDGTGPLA